SAPDSPRAHLAREARKSPVRPSPAAQCTTICRPAWAWVRVCWIACSRSALRRHSKIRDGQIHHLEARLVVQRAQMTSALVETFGIAGEEDDHRNLLRTKAVVGVAMQVIGSEGHRTPEDPTRQTKGQFCQRHGSNLAPSRVGPCQRPHAYSFRGDNDKALGSMGFQQRPDDMEARQSFLEGEVFQPHAYYESYCTLRRLKHVAKTARRVLLLPSAHSCRLWYDALAHAHTGITTDREETRWTLSRSWIR